MISFHNFIIHIYVSSKYRYDKVSKSFYLRVPTSQPNPNSLNICCVKILFIIKVGVLIVSSEQ
jgi:hypothetical protein